MPGRELAGEGAEQILPVPLLQWPTAGSSDSRRKGARGGGVGSVHHGSPGRGEWLGHAHPAENPEQAEMGVNGGSCPWHPFLPRVPRGHSQLPVG